jgi:copper(I)-binding protein
MPRWILLVVFALGALALGVACGDDDDDAAGDGHSHAITAVGLWARQTAGVEGESAAIYGTIENSQHEDDTLLEIRVPAEVGRAAALHSTVMENQTMRMVEEPDFALAAEGELELAPGAMHVMVMGLAERLEEGDEFDVTFVFEHAGEVTAAVEVRAVDATE